MKIPTIIHYAGRIGIALALIVLSIVLLINYANLYQQAHALLDSAINNPFKAAAVVLVLVGVLVVIRIIKEIWEVLDAIVRWLFRKP